MKILLLAAVATLAVSSAHAGVLCVFVTEKAVVSYSLGFISGDDLRESDRTRHRVSGRPE